MGNWHEGIATYKQRVEDLPNGIYPLIDCGNGNGGTGIVDVGSGVIEIGSGFNLREYIGKNGCLHIT